MMNRRGAITDLAVRTSGNGGSLNEALLYSDVNLTSEEVNPC